MLLRRSLYYAQFALAIIMPTWVLVNRGILAEGVGTPLIVYLVVCPVLSIAMVVMATLIAARGTVRAAKAISWRDAALQLGIWLTLFFYGVFGFPLLAVLAVLLLIGGFWLELAEFLREAKTWVTKMFEVAPAARPRSNIDGPTSGPNVIVIPPQPPA